MAKILSARNDIASQVGGDVMRGLDPDSSGNSMFKSEDTLSAGYTDKTTLTNWDLYGAQIDGLKYNEFRNILIVDFVGTWATLIDTDKKTLVRHYVYDSTETTANLDLLYTQAERDDFMNQVVKSLNVCDCNLRKETNSESYWNVLPGSTGELTITKLKTDVSLDTYDSPLSSISFAELYMNNNIIDTVIAAVSTMTKIAGTTIKGEASADFTHANNKLTYTGAKTKKFKVTSTTTTARATGTGNKLGRFAIFKSGVEQTKTLSGNKDIGFPSETTFQGIVEMATNDYIEMFIENKTDTEDFTIKNMMVIAVEIKQ